MGGGNAHTCTCIYASCCTTPCQCCEQSNILDALHSIHIVLHSRNGHDDVVRCLVNDAHYDPNVRNDGSMTPLNLACRSVLHELLDLCVAIRTVADCVAL